jgi:hypothetical protein
VFYASYFYDLFLSELVADYWLRFLLGFAFLDSSSMGLMDFHFSLFAFVFFGSFGVRYITLYLASSISRLVIGRSSHNFSSCSMPVAYNT